MASDEELDLVYKKYINIFTNEVDKLPPSIPSSRVQDGWATVRFILELSPELYP